MHRKHRTGENVTFGKTGEEIGLRKETWGSNYSCIV